METSTKQSATGFVERISKLAHTAAGKPVPETTKESVPLVPIYIGVDRDHEQLREVSRTTTLFENIAERIPLPGRLPVAVGCVMLHHVNPCCCCCRHCCCNDCADVPVPTWR